MKKLLSLLLVLSLALCLCGCVTSPTAVKINGSAIDASEVAFYLHYNQSEGDLAQVKEAALKQLVTAELVRQKCKEMKLTLSDEQKKALAQEKKALKEQLGGTAAYLEYLEESLLTDRGYDKFQENTLYYEMLYHLVLEENKALYTDEYLRQFFTSDYLSIQYICLNRLDNEGNPLSEEADNAKRSQAESALNALLADNANIFTVIEEYNEDPDMMGLTEPLILSRNQIENDYPFLLAGFDLNIGEIDGIYTTDSGYYVLIRSSLSANYYTEHQEEIYYTAVDANFQKKMDAWQKASTIVTTKVFDQMTLENLTDYLK